MNTEKKGQFDKTSPSPEPDYFSFSDEERARLIASIRLKRGKMQSGTQGISFTPREHAFLEADRSVFNDDQPTEEQESLLNE